VADIESPAWRSRLDDVLDLELRVLAARFYRYLSDDDMSGHDVMNMAENVEAMRAWAHRREPGTALVRGWTPPIQGVGYSVIEVVTDDMPFLVDSVTANLVHGGRNVHLIVHPQLAVRRDLEGNLLEILDVDVEQFRSRCARPYRASRASR